MPNWCDNNMTVYGSKNEVLRFTNFINRAMSISNDNNQLYNTFILAGFTDEEIGNIGFCRGNYLDKPNFDFSNGKATCVLCFETAWAPMVEAWDKLLQRLFPKLKQVTLAEESGSEVYINTDEQGLFYEEKWCVDGVIDGDYSREYEAYFDSDEAALSFINEFAEKHNLKHDFKTIEEAKLFFENESQNRTDEEFFFNIYQYSRN